MKAVFDSNILIDYLNAIPQAAQELALYSDKVISVITFIEVLAGARTKEHEVITRAFLGNFEIRSLSQTIAEKTIELRKLNKRKLPDIIIYATAKVESCMFVTRNTKDFDSTLVDVRVPYQI